MVESTYFLIAVDGTDERSVYLGDPIAHNETPIDPRIFNECIQVNQYCAPLQIEIDQPGENRHLNLCAFDMLVVSNVVANVIGGMTNESDVQLLPAQVRGEQAKYWIVNVLRCIPCLDEQNSVLLNWPGDPVKISKGAIPFVAKLAIQGPHIVGSHIFRVKEWPLALIISRTLHDAIYDAIGDTKPGVAFKPVPSR